MKFGVREICDVVLKAKSIQKIGNRVFYKDEPVLYFDSLKTSSLEGAATTVYAQGGRGNSRLIAWEGERTVTFTMEDALLSPESFSILTGAGIIKANKNDTIKSHASEETAVIEYCAPVANAQSKFFRTCTSQKIIDKAGTSGAVENIDPTVTYFYRIPETGTQYIEKIGHPEKFSINDKHYWHEKGEAQDTSTAKTYYKHVWSDSTIDLKYINHAQLCIYMSELPYIALTNNTDKYDGEKYIHVIRTLDHECISEPFYPDLTENQPIVYMDDPHLKTLTTGHESAYCPEIYGKYRIMLNTYSASSQSYNIPLEDFQKTFLKNVNGSYQKADKCAVLVDYYVENSGGYKINITPDKFGSNFYLEGSTLFRSTNGADLPAKIIIPNCKIQSNFTLSMASSGDPSTFTFTLDAFPDFLRWDTTKKVLAAIQLIDANDSGQLPARTDTPGSEDFMSIASEAIRDSTWSRQQPKEV